MKNEKCPTPHKTKYAIALEADVAAKQMKEKYDSDQYMYPCPCGWWHLTTRRRTGGIFRVRADGSPYLDKDKYHNGE